ncbi:MAG: hypothetical protein C0401_07805 [Anaerolinea sp.]|nr:hypothetical protein [Anaerolinea sp.]
MPVNFLTLQPQIRLLGETAVARKSELAHKLQACRELLQQHDADLITLQKTVEEAATKNKGLRCAAPVTELLASHHPSVLPAPACTILAADGSQINPDPHGSALFGLVNVGVFRMRPGSGETPGIKVFSDLLHDETLQSQIGLASEDLIALLRDVKEREILAKLAETETAPIVTLTDGPLELYHEPRQDPQFEPEFKRYLSALDDLALNNGITAGYVDRPRADLVVRLLELMTPHDQINSDPHARPFGGITDLSLFENILNPGERSAVFRLQSSSATSFKGRKALHFFYLNVGSANKSTLARVEVPLWVIENPTSLETLQSVLVEQSRQAGSRPYPYPLIRAHEIAVVKMDDRQQITTMIETELIKRGFPPSLNSNKQSNKQHQGRMRK